MSFVTGAGYGGKILKTSSVNTLILLLNETRYDVIEAPKGSGKTCLCAMVYLSMIAQGVNDHGVKSMLDIASQHFD